MENISNFFAKKCCKKYKKMILYIGQKKGLWFQMKNEKDTHIKITGVEGVKLKVEPVKQTSNK